MNQFHASGKSLFKSTLKQSLKSQINEIKISKNLSKEEKNSKIFTLKRAIQRKIRQSDFYNF